MVQWINFNRSMVAHRYALLWAYPQATSMLADGFLKFSDLQVNLIIEVDVAYIYL